MDYHNDYQNNLKDRQYERHEKYDWDNSVRDEVSIGTWLIVLILLAIPILNIIVFLVLALGDHNVNLKNFAKASLIIMAVGFLFAMLFGGCSYY